MNQFHSCKSFPLFAKIAFGTELAGSSEV